MKMKPETHLTKEQIEEIADLMGYELYYQEGMTKKDSEYYRKLLTEKFGEPNEPEEKWPLIGDKFYFINILGHVEGQYFTDTDRNEHGMFQCLKEIGNLYRTKEAAEAVVKLRKHIQKFKMPESKSGCFILSFSDGEEVVDLWAKTRFSSALSQRSEWYAGNIMPIFSTEADRTERIRLLKLVYDN